MNPYVEHDRGLGTAYERYCFYQLVDRWATQLDVKSALEGPIDGMAGVPGVHCVGLARRGVPVTSAVTTERQAMITRGVYARAGAKADVRVVRAEDAKTLPQADMVIVYHALSFVDDWRAHLSTMASRARKVLIVAVVNPENWGVTAMRWVGKLRGVTGFEPPAAWRKETLAPALAALGRVREHTYFDCPWWPDLPGLSAGQSLTNRAKQLLMMRKADVSFTAKDATTGLSDKYVYGVARWPYFGDDGWHDELLPALLTHPTFEAASDTVRSRTAHLHAYVVERTSS
jgi:hypothetical protein